MSHRPDSSASTRSFHSARDLPDSRGHRWADESDADVRTADNLYGGLFRTVRSSLEHVKSLGLRDPPQLWRDSTNRGGPHEPRAVANANANVAAPASSKREREGATGFAPPQTTKWTEMARQGNIEMNMRKVEETARAERLGLRGERDSEHRPTSSPTDAADRFEERVREEERRRQRFEAAELREVTNLQIQLEAQKHEHDAAVAELRARHREDLAKQEEAFRSLYKKDKDALVDGERKRYEAERRRLEEELAKFRAEQNQLLEELHSLRNGATESNVRTENLESKLRDVQQECKRKHQQAEDSLRERALLEKELDRLRREHELVKTASVTVESNLRSENIRLESRVAQIQQACEDAKTMQERLAKERDDAVEAYKEQVKKKDAQMTELLEKAKAAVGESKAVHKILDSVKLQLLAAEQARLLCEGKLTDEVAGSRDLSKALDAARHDADLLQEKLTNAEIRFADRDGALRNAEIELKDLRSKVPQLLEDRSRLSDLLTKVKDDLEHERGRVREMQQQHQLRSVEAQQTIEALKSERDRLTKDNARLAGIRDTTVELSKARAEAKKWKDDYARATEELDNLREELRRKAETQRRDTRSIPKPRVTASGGPSPRRTTSGDAALGNPDLRQLELRKRELQTEFNISRLKALDDDRMFDAVRATLLSSKKLEHAERAP